MIYVLSFLAIIGFLILITIPLSIWSERQRKKKIEAVFDGRQELDEYGFYEKYFQSRGVPFFVVEKVRKILEDVLEADLSRLSAEDDFSKELNFFWQADSLADVELIEQLQEKFEIKFLDSEVANLRTVNDVVNLTWQRVRESEEAG